MRTEFRSMGPYRFDAWLWNLVFKELREPMSSWLIGAIGFCAGRWWLYSLTQ